MQPKPFSFLDETCLVDSAAAFEILCSKEVWIKMVEISKEKDNKIIKI